MNSQEHLYLSFTIGKIFTKFEIMQAKMYRFDKVTPIVINYFYHYKEHETLIYNLTVGGEKQDYAFKSVTILVNWDEHEAI